MKAIVATLSEIVGLFVDDGSLALAIIVFVGIVAALVKWALIPGPIGGALLFFGLVAILGENLWRSARRLHRH